MVWGIDSTLKPNIWTAHLEFINIVLIGWKKSQHGAALLIKYVSAMSRCHFDLALAGALPPFSSFREEELAFTSVTVFQDHTQKMPLLLWKPSVPPCCCRLCFPFRVQADASELFWDRLLKQVTSFWPFESSHPGRGESYVFHTSTWCVSYVCYFASTFSESPGSKLQQRPSGPPAALPTRLDNQKENGNKASFIFSAVFFNFRVNIKPIVRPLSALLLRAITIICEYLAGIEETSGADKKNGSITFQAKKSSSVVQLHRWCVGCHSRAAFAAYLFPGFLYLQGLFILAVTKTPDGKSYGY